MRRVSQRLLGSGCVKFGGAEREKDGEGTISKPFEYDRKPDTMDFEQPARVAALKVQVRAGTPWINGEKETTDGVKICVPTSERGLMQGVPRINSRRRLRPLQLHLGVGIGQGGTSKRRERSGGRDIRWDFIVALPGGEHWSTVNR